MNGNDQDNKEQLIPKERVIIHGQKRKVCPVKGTIRGYD